MVAQPVETTEKQSEAEIRCQTFWESLSWLFDVKLLVVAPIFGLGVSTF